MTSNKIKQLMLSSVAVVSISLTGCQAAHKYTPVSEETSCLEIAQNYDENEKIAQEQCADGWRIAGRFRVGEHPFVGIVEGNTLAGAKQVLKEELRYCDDQLLDNFYESFNAWNTRMCTEQSPSHYRHYTFDQVKQFRERGIQPVSRPTSIWAVDDKQMVINDPFLGCQGPACSK
ncbi:MAG: hypothetical protein ACFHHU_00785 [Porticoccaceae bacterium]